MGNFIGLMGVYLWENLLGELLPTTKKDTIFILMAPTIMENSKKM